MTEKLSADQAMTKSDTPKSFDEEKAAQKNSNPEIANKEEEDNDDVTDILGNKTITKRTLSAGLGRQSRPNHGDRVTISVRGWLQSQPITAHHKTPVNGGENDDAKCFFRAERLDFVLGDNDVIQAFDLSVALAETNELFEVISDARFAYGTKGAEMPALKDQSVTPCTASSALLKSVPPNSPVRFHILVVCVNDPPDYAGMPIAERLRAANQKRERGNELYRREEFSLAVNSYSCTLRILDGVSTTAPPPSPTSPAPSPPPSPALSGDQTPPHEQARAVLVAARNNMAAAQMKLEAWEAALDSCEAVLRLDPQNIKAMFRKGRALGLGRQDWSGAVKVLRNAVDVCTAQQQQQQQQEGGEVESSLRMCRDELQKALRKHRADMEQRSRMFRNMFPGASQSEAAAASKKRGGALMSVWESARRSSWTYVAAAAALLTSIGLAVVATTQSSSATIAASNAGA